jgi:hypothetical protein
MINKLKLRANVHNNAKINGLSGGRSWGNKMEIAIASAIAESNSLGTTVLSIILLT